MHRLVGTFVVAVGLVCTSAWGISPLKDMDVALQKHDAGTFYVHGAIKGYGDLDLLVDTGASFLVINESILASLKAGGNARFSRELRGLMADGSRRVVPMYRISAMRLGESCWIHDVDAAIFPADSQPILGMNILTRLAPFTFATEPPRLALNSCQTLNPRNLVREEIPADTAITSTTVVH